MLFVFLSNGEDVWFLDRETDAPRAEGRDPLLRVERVPPGLRRDLEHLLEEMADAGDENGREHRGPTNGRK